MLLEKHSSVCAWAQGWLTLCRRVGTTQLAAVTVQVKVTFIMCRFYVALVPCK